MFLRPRGQGLFLRSAFTTFARFCMNERMDILCRMRRLGLLFLLLSIGGLMFRPAQAQRSEIGFGAGGSFYMGDINPKRVFYKTRFAGTLFYRYNFTTRMALRVSGSYGRIEAWDRDFGNPRGLGFRNDLWEFSALFEVNFLDFFTGSRQHWISPYLVLGVGAVYSNPQGQYLDGSWVDLRPLGTEGQGQDGGKLYSRVHAVIPAGLGVKVSVCRFMSVGLEWTMRLALTDYLDDVGGTYASLDGSPKDPNDKFAYFADPPAFADPSLKHQAGSRRGDQGTLDWYSFATFTVSFRLPGKDELCPAYNGAGKKKK